MSVIIPFDASVFTEEQAQELEAAFAVIQQWSAGPAGLTLPTMRVGLSANQSIPNSVALTNVVFNNLTPASGDPNYGGNSGIFLNSNGNVILGVGRYRLQASVAFDNNATGIRNVVIVEFQSGNDGGALSLFNCLTIGAVAQTIIQCSATVDVPANTQYRYGVGVFQNSGGALNLMATTNTWFQVTKIG